MLDLIAFSTKISIMIKTTTTKKTSTITVDSINKAQQVMIQAMKVSNLPRTTSTFFNQ
jgi:hypothetical protein